MHLGWHVYNISCDYIITYINIHMIHMITCFLCRVRSCRDMTDTYLKMSSDFRKHKRPFPRADSHGGFIFETVKTIISPQPALASGDPLIFTKGKVFFGEPSEKICDILWYGLWPRESQFTASLEPTRKQNCVGSAIVLLVGGFPYIGNVIIPTDKLIFFQRGRSTTNQIVK